MPSWRYLGRDHLWDKALCRTVTFNAAVLLMLWCATAALTDAYAASLQRVEFDSAAQRRISGVFPGDRIQGYLARPDGAGPFPAVIGLHGCAGMHDTTKRRLADELVAGAMSSCSSTAMQHVASNTPAAGPRVRPS